jgi:hypothetical protein
MTLSIEGFSRVVAFPTAPIATGRATLAGRDFHPLKNRVFPRHTLIARSPWGPGFLAPIASEIIISLA